MVNLANDIYEKINIIRINKGMNKVDLGVSKEASKRRMYRLKNQAEKIRVGTLFKMINFLNIGFDEEKHIYILKNNLEELKKTI